MQPPKKRIKGQGHMDFFCLKLNLMSVIKVEETYESCQMMPDRIFKNGNFEIFTGH